MRTCSYPPCDQPHSAKGFCAAHYQQHVVRGLPLGPVGVPPPPKPVCSFDGCKKTSITKGLCKAHYAQLRRTGVLKPIRVPHQPCAVAGCDGKWESRGLCSRHAYHRDVKGIAVEDMKPIRRRRKHTGETKCVVEGCGRPTEILDWCNYHYHRQDRGLPPEPTRKAKSDEGDKKTHARTGYVFVKVERARCQTKRRTWVQEHRLVMEDHLGRPLHRHETVHHKNGNRAGQPAGELGTVVAVSSTGSARGRPGGVGA